MDPIIAIVLLLIVVGLILWLVPLDPPIKALIEKVVVVVVVVAVVIWLLGVFGIWHGGSVRLTR